jgi:uncharacterized protein YndB with AHSA1/START domain
MCVSTLTEIDHTSHTIRFKRTFDVARERVFDAWTKPEQVTAWWDPEGTPLVACTIDLRVGGAFTFVNAKHSLPFAGTYRTVVRPSTLVFEAMGAVGTVSLRDEGGKTKMTVSIACASLEHFEMFLTLDVDSGTARTLENLGRHVSH